MLSATRHLLKSSNITQTLMNRNISSLVKNVSSYCANGVKKKNSNFIHFPILLLELQSTKSIAMSIQVSFHKENQ